MAKDNNASAENTQEVFEAKPLLIAQKENEKFIKCEVCGYANPEKTSICKMCSNYL